MDTTRIDYENGSDIVRIQHRGEGELRTNSYNCKTSKSLFEKVCLHLVLFLALLLFLSTRLEVPVGRTRGGDGCDKAAAAAAAATATGTTPTITNTTTTTVTTITTITSTKDTEPERESKDDNNEQKYEAFNHTNPHLDSWCPYAQCYNSPVCTPCNRRFLFIISTGRSGSTTLLKMLNLLPNVRISGENYNELYFASQLIDNIKQDEKNFYSKKFMKEDGRFMHKPIEDGPFMHNAMPIGSMACITQDVISALNPPDLTKHKMDNNKNNNNHGKSRKEYGSLWQYLNHPEIEAKRILGVKTIRLQNSPNFSPDKAMIYLTENFPCARFVVNIRSDTEALTKSVLNAFSKDDYDDTFEKFKEKTTFLKRLAKLLNEGGNGNSSSDRARLIDMEEWKDDVSIFNDLLDWLGFENCSFPKVLHENFDGYEHDNSEISLGEQCIYPHV